MTSLILFAQPGDIFSAQSGISLGLATAVIAAILVPIATGIIYLVWNLASIKTGFAAHEVSCQQDSQVQWKRHSEHSDAIKELKATDSSMAATLFNEIQAAKHDVLNRADAAFVRRDTHALEMQSIDREMRSVNEQIKKCCDSDE